MRRLRPLSEAECYARCYGDHDSTVTAVKAEPRFRRSVSTVSGEELRRRLEERLDERLVPEADAA